MNWLIETGVFPNTDSLIATIQESGHRCKKLEYAPYHFGLENLFRHDDCVVVYGSIDLCMQVQRQPWVPGAYCTFKNYAVSQYYSVLKDMLLNVDSAIFSSTEVGTNPDRIFQDTDSVFIRPNSGHKPFAGQVVQISEFSRFRDTYLHQDVDIVVSTPKNVEEEWRFFVRDGKAITGSLYRVNGVDLQSSEYDAKARDLAELAASKYQPDTIFAVDICKTADSYRVVEVISFSCAGIYMSDTKILVEHIAEQALADWRRDPISEGEDNGPNQLGFTEYPII